MKIVLCDICKMREADQRFKVKQSEKNCDYYYGNKYWTFYRKIDVCKECANKLFLQIEIKGKEDEL